MQEPRRRTFEDMFREPSTFRAEQSILPQQPLCPGDKVVVTYCDGVFCNASTEATTKLTTLGFKVKEMLYDMQGWRKEGYPVKERFMQMTIAASQ